MQAASLGAEWLRGAESLASATIAVGQLVLVAGLLVAALVHRCAFLKPNALGWGKPISEFWAYGQGRHRVLSTQARRALPRCMPESRVTRLASPCRRRTRAAAAASEADVMQPLLAGQRATHIPGMRKPRPEGSWVTALGKSIVFVWPKRPWLQARAFACIGLVLLTRVLNVFVPIAYGKMVDVFADVRGLPAVYPSFASIFFPWVFLYLLARCLQGGGAWLLFVNPCSFRVPWRSSISSIPAGKITGRAQLQAPTHKLVAAGPCCGLAVVPEAATPGSRCCRVRARDAHTHSGAGGVGSVGAINNLRQYLWIPISQDGERRISLQAFEHILFMDLGFHLRRKTGALPGHMNWHERSEKQERQEVT